MKWLFFILFALIVISFVWSFINDKGKPILDKIKSKIKNLK
jgi:hypothetical protein